MKTLLLTISILFSLNSFSQAYLPMLEEGNVWNVVIAAYPHVSNISHEIVGQEVINGVTYYNVTNFCLMREENGKVYTYNANEGIDELLYDFTLEVGDTIFLDSNNQPYCYEIGGNYSEGEPLIVVMTSTQFIAGANRKVIELEYVGNYAETLIEGIGSLSGVIPYSFTHYDMSTALSCFTNNGITYYFNDYTECIILETEDFNKNSIKLYPNPVTNISKIKLPNDIEIQSINIYDVFGRLIKTEKINSEYIAINANEYLSGIYFYQLFSNGKIVKTDKFIVK